MKKKVKSLSVIVPCYNEEDVIESTIIKVESVLTTLQNDLKIINSYEIIVVNNGSTDDTPIELKKRLNQNQLASIRSIRIDNNQGYGHGILTGLEAAKGEA